MLHRLMLGLLLLAPTGALATDTILHNGTVYTLRGDRPAAVGAIALSGGAVLATGSDEEVLAWAEAHTRVVDLRGAWVIPGLTDAHAHLYNLGFSLSTVDLRGTRSASECIERARSTEASLAADEWLRGRSWDQNDWPGQEYPDRSMLDEAFGDRPVYFERVDGHAVWVNSAALERAGIGADTPDPEGGEILRDGDGRPTGILVDRAEALVAGLIAEPPAEAIESTYRRAIDEVHRWGLTGVHDMGASVEELAVLARGEAEGWLDLRLVCTIGGAGEFARYEGGPLRPGPAARLWIDGVKLYTDGALGSRGAALLEDYSDRPGHRGLLIQSPEVLEDQVLEVMRRDFAPVLHAIGDRGNQVALDALIGAWRRLDTERPLASWHPRIEHAQVVAPADFARFAEHGIVAGVQPTHCTSDMPWAGERLGEARLEGAYAWRTFLDLGVALPLGSDFPVEETSPWLGLYAARTRHSVEADRSWSADQCLTPLEALLGFTAWPAEVIGAAGWGRLVEGSRADLVVVDRDPLGDDAAELLETTVELTMVDGEVVYSSGRYDQSR